MFTRSFWLDALERALRTFAQTILAVATADGTGIVRTDMSIGPVITTALLAGVLSVVTSLASAPAGREGTASVTTVMTPTPPGDDGRHPAR